MDYSQMAIPKPEPIKRSKNRKHKEDKELRDREYEKAFERDGHRCLKCDSPNPEPHHAFFGKGHRKHDHRLIVSLCHWCHKDGPEAAHKSKYWRNYWMNYLAKLYPEFWKQLRDNQKIS